VKGPEPQSDPNEGTPDFATQIVAQQARFLNLLIPRVGDRAAAEDILQSAYLKAVEHQAEIRSEESTVAWFYRILRNAITDNFRREAARSRAYDGLAIETPTSYEPELKSNVCACIGDVIQDLKPEYRDAIQQVDLDGMTVQAFAQEHSTTANNASVRLHRARKDVVRRLTAVCGTCAKHRCLDCPCRHSRL